MYCILCDKPKQKKDQANLILLKGKSGFVMMNLYPYNNGHLMVSPYKHADTLEDLSNEVLKDLMQMVKQSLAALRKAFQPEGINVGLNLGKAAGAGIEDHLHFHVVPRWEGDTNFMTVLSESRVIPESMTETYRHLKPHFEVE